MKPPVFTDYGLDFISLSPVIRVDQLVVHHTGNPTDDDLSAEQIHRSHLMQGWSGIGYHYVIRKDGTVEIGRPEWAIGAHAYGENWHTLGIHVCGNFEYATPTSMQIESLAYLLGWLCEKYSLSPTEAVVGHRDLMATACPGLFLYRNLETVIGKAAWYMRHYKNGEYEENV